MTRWMLILGAVGCSSGTPEGAITLTVPGALRIAAHCGGEETVHQRGDTAEFVPAGPLCEIEAPMSPVLPLYGQLRVGSERAYRCERHGVDLECGPAH